MADRNQVEQIVKLNNKQYLDAQRQIRTQTRSNFDDVNKTLHESANRYDEFTNRTKRNSASLSSTLKDLGKSFADNLGRGMAAGAIGGGALALKSQMQESIRTGLDFGKTFSALASRADLSASKVKSLREELKRLGAASSADLGSLPTAVNELFGATGNIDKSMGVMGPISQAAGLTSDRDAGKVAKFVIDRLKGEGRDINSGSVNSVLQGLVLTQRGGEFSNLDAAMEGVSGIDANTKSRAKLSDRDLAALLAGTSKAGVNKETGAAGLQALIRASTDELSGNNIFGGMLGVGSLRSNGKFDLSRLRGAHVPGGNDNQKIEIMKQTLGVSDKEAAGILGIIKNFDAVKKGMDKTMADTKTLSQAVEESTDNLSDNLSKLRNSMVVGFDDIFKPIEDLANNIVKGNFGKALKAVPGALGEVASGVASHPLLVAGGLASAAGAGMLLKKLGLGGAASSVGTGKALQQMGVTPVYVVNAFDIANGKSGGTSLERVKELMGGIAGGGGIGAVVKGIGLGTAALWAGGAAAAGAAGYGAGMLINKGIDSWTQGETKEGFQGNAVERLLFKLDQLTDGLLSGKWGDNMRQSMDVNIHSVDPQFMAKPSTKDLNREGR